MGNGSSCFVIIGYGKKTSYANGKIRSLDLDQTFELLIKPVFDQLGIPCYRAVDKNISGSIDKLMLHEIKTADITVADISTLNANVMWELGVRHALKPKHTIMICEKEQMSAIPFDINHFVVHEYVHSEVGIPYTEVSRFKGVLTKVVQALLIPDTVKTDSPVFTFLSEETGDSQMKAQQYVRSTADISFSQLIKEAEEKKNNRNFQKAFSLFHKAKKIAEDNISLQENLAFIISRQALCTYKMKEPNETEALHKAEEILQTLNPQQSNDLEVIGLSGAIKKRLYEVTGNSKYLAESLAYYEKGFFLKLDYYNGINAVFILYLQASEMKERGNEWKDIMTKADYFRNTVLEICKRHESEEDFSSRLDAIWILLTMAEIFHYKGDAGKQKEYEQKAEDLALKNQDHFAVNSYIEQREKVIKIKSKLT